LKFELGVVVYPVLPAIGEAEAGGSLEPRDGNQLGKIGDPAS
jgi:hypothetical protein